jgi:RHS repeat-associated protein
LSDESPSCSEKVRYAEEMQDSPTGLYYVYARYMDPELGRFTSLDPVLRSQEDVHTLRRLNQTLGDKLDVRRRFARIAHSTNWVCHARSAR